MRLVTGHPPPRQPDRQLVFHEAHLWAETMPATATVDSGQGRREPRRLTASSALLGDRDWPGLAQVFPLERGVILQKSGAQRHEIVSGVTSLGPDQAGPERLRGLVRPPWQLEQQVHWVREVPSDADRSPVRGGRMPPLLAACRHTAIGLRHWAGETTIAAACRRLAAPPWSALALSGISPDN